MATTLQQQLAAIAANSTHQLDLKAQKARHGKSLLFEPRDAASQNFDTIFQICYEGFQELCMLDARFVPFARTLFSEQSKSADRTQMTAAENDDLDRTIKSFMGLVCGRLLLKPAMKAVEWLVRRFAAHEHETEWLLLTFLPYHTSHIFPTLLSILPEQLPASFRFLHPYVASLQGPPRHAVLAAAISNQGFFTVFSEYVLNTAKARNQSAVLLGFWASITAQAVNGMIDSTRSGRDAIRKQREEDLLLRILPVLQSALSIKDVPDLYLGSCMIMTILATKASLEDKVLDAMMETVAFGWAEQTVEDGLICLAVMAEEKHQIHQPRAVTRAVLRLENPTQKLGELSDRYRTERLILATCLSALTSPAQSDLDAIEFTKSVIERQILSDGHLTALAENILLRIKTLPQSEGSSGLRESLVSGLGDLMAQETMALAVNRAAVHSNIELSEISDQLTIELAINDETAEEEEPELMALDDLPESQKDQVDAIISALASLDKKHQSFLDPANSETAAQYCDAFQSVVAIDQQLHHLLDMETLQKNAVRTKPTFLSYLTTVWTGIPSTQGRVRSLEAATTELKKGSSDTPLDLQALVPYAIVALGDSAQRVRRAAAALCLQLSELTKNLKVSKTCQVWCKDSFYGPDSKKIHWLSSQDAHKFLNSAVLPILEDCVLDSAHISRSLADALNGVVQTKSSSKLSDHKEMKVSTRNEICVFLASHVAATPVPSVKAGLLQVLEDIGKCASDARKTVLLPFVNEWRVLPFEQAEMLCRSAEVDLATLDKAILAVFLTEALTNYNR